MVKNGTQRLYLALVNQDLNGMDNIVKNLTNARMEEFGVLSTTNAFALMDPTGPGSTACQSRNA